MKYQFAFTKKVRAAWVKALRSGKFKQGENSLKDGDTYCCLGVLADIQGAVWKDDSPFHGCKETTLTRSNSRTSIVRGLPSGVQDDLAKQNDNGRSFAEIAEFVAKLPVVKARS